ncbi:hypothetical protein DJ568_01535 [Mucilaginibacter hurinus]|uniref:Uncharacterized protein n=1 Tax=Mucilaginibacter hurinus TaxID=2201324 RepID=A0A367GTR7_9SPHI|nr:hypothetical protein [Mucilaginibacter hurinus]RCH56568.1 hypothetical protein DJ568_01535 [Mucilaginibacter hurinus]
MDDNKYPEDTGQDDTEQEQYSDESGAVEIYSKSAIWGFTIFFSMIFGGVLLMQNLRAAGYKKAGNVVLLFSIIYTLLSFAIGFVLAPGVRYIGVITNIIGGAVLTEYFYNKYFPDNDYYPKPIWRALGVSILIVLIIALILAMLIASVPGLKEQLEAIK